MTIKQHGGIFGRNPTFNNVQVDNDIAADGNVSVGGNASVTGGATFGETISTSQSIKFGTGGTFDAGCIYSDANWGVIFRAKQDSPAQAKFLFSDAAGLEVARFTNSNNLAFQSGNGIDFSATAGTGTSELFDDYEEGTYTATVGCTGNATTTTTVTGYYTKIGRQVTVGFRNLNNIDTTGLSGFFTISLPFSCMSGSTASFLGKTAWKELTYPANITQVDATVSNGGGTMTFQLAGATGSGGLLGVASVTSGTSDIQSLSLTYFTA